MKKILTDTEKVAALTGAINRADRELNLILEPMDYRTSERLLTVCRRVRKILRRALEKVCGPHAGQAAGGACTAVVGRTYRPPDGCITQSGRRVQASASTQPPEIRQRKEGGVGKPKKEIVVPHIDREKIREKCIELCLDLDLGRSLLYGKPDKNLRHLTRKVVRGEIGAPRMDAMIRLADRSGYELNATREGEAWRIQDRKDAERLMLRMNEVACTIYRRCAMRALETNGISVKALRSYTDKDKSLPRLDRLLILAELLGYSFSWYDAMNRRRVNEAYFRWAHSTELYRKSERRRTESTRKP